MSAPDMHTPTGHTDDEAVPVAAALHERPGIAALRRVLTNPMGLAGAVMLTLIVGAALLAPILTPYGPADQHPGSELLPPGGEFLLGTDELGRDLFTRIVYGAQLSLRVGGIAVVLGAVAGVLLGLVSGYFGGWLDAIIMRTSDVVLAYPAILLGIIVVVILGPGVTNVAIAIAVASAPTFARLVRAVVLREREREFVQAARVLGAGPWRIIREHLLPNSMGPVLVQMSLVMGIAILLESALSFVGLGTQPPDPSWGAMLDSSRSYLREAPWYGFFPGLALAILLIGVNLFADALRDALDPHKASGQS